MKTGNKMSNGSGAPDWWRAVAAEEKAVIRDLFSTVRALKRSRSRHVAEAARKWERSIACFIKWRLINEGRKREAGA